MIHGITEVSHLPCGPAHSLLMDDFTAGSLWVRRCYFALLPQHLTDCCDMKWSGKTCICCEPVSADRGYASAMGWDCYAAPQNLALVKMWQSAQAADYWQCLVKLSPVRIWELNLSHKKMKCKKPVLNHVKYKINLNGKQ